MISAVATSIMIYHSTSPSIVIQTSKSDLIQDNDEWIENAELAIKIEQNKLDLYYYEKDKNEWIKMS